MMDADVVISQPFWPAYITAERMAKSPNLKMCLTAGIGSDHVDLDAAMARNISVTEVTFCNSISVAEHVVMMILGLVRNYIPSYKQASAPPRTRPLLTLTATAPPELPPLTLPRALTF